MYCFCWIVCFHIKIQVWITAVLGRGLPNDSPLFNFFKRGLSNREGGGLSSKGLSIRFYGIRFGYTGKTKSECIHFSLTVYLRECFSPKQSSKLHLAVSASGGQGLPPFSEGSVTDRYLICWPRPHVLLHCVHSLHWLTSQSVAKTFTVMNYVVF